jgi:hypothetical protein
MNDIKQLKEKTINDYISQCLLDENNIDIDKMKEDLSILLGEKPGIELEYKSEKLILEDGKKIIKKEKLESIHIYYTYENDGKYYFGNLNYLTD